MQHDHIYVGLDWSEQHHDVCVLDHDGHQLATTRIPDGIDGIARLHGLLAGHADEPGRVTIAIELDRGLLISALREAGYRLVKVEPFAIERFRDRWRSSSAKNDTADARVLADAARTDGHRLREIAGTSTAADAIRVIARAQQTAVWDRTRTTQRLRHALREYYPAALVAFDDLDHPQNLAVLKIAPTPELGRRLSRSRIAAILRRAGRVQRVDERAAAIQTALRAQHLTAPPVIADAHATIVTAYIGVLEAANRQIEALTAQLAESFGEHPDAEILLSFPGLGDVTGARVLGEFGDDPERFTDVKSRRNYAGTSPITRQSGQQRGTRARHVRNRRLADAIDRWAQAAICGSPGARAFYDRQRSTGRTHRQALRALGNKLVGQLHGALRHRALYDEEHAWRDQPVALAA